MNQLKSKCTSYLGLKHKLGIQNWYIEHWETEDHQTDKPAATGVTASCNDNSRWHQRRQSCQNDQNDDPLLLNSK